MFLFGWYALSIVQSLFNEVYNFNEFYSSFLWLFWDSSLTLCNLFFVALALLFIESLRTISFSFRVCHSFVLSNNFVSVFQCVCVYSCSQLGSLWCILPVKLYCLSYICMSAQSFFLSLSVFVRHYAQIDCNAILW